MRPNTPILNRPGSAFRPHSVARFAWCLGRHLAQRLAPLAALLAGLIILPSGVRGEALLLENGRFIDPIAEIVFEGAILVRDSRIERLVPAAALATFTSTFEGARLSLDGRFVIPGLVDLHVHSYGNLGPDGVPELLGTVGTGHHMLYAGVVAFLDLSSFEDDILGLRDRQRSTNMLVADLHSAGTALTCPGGHGTQFPNPAREVTTPAEAIASVDELAAKRPDVIKLIYNPSGRHRPSIDLPTMEAIVARATVHGIKTVAHVDHWTDAEDAVRAGVDAITHTPAGPPPPSLVALMATHGTAIIPTLAVHTELAAIRASLDAERASSSLASNPVDSPLLQALSHEALRAAYRNPDGWLESRHGWADRQDETRQLRLDAVATLARGGVTVLNGTDAGNPGVFQGYSVHRELALLVEAGLSPWQALRSATTDAGAFLGRRIGMQVGDQASFVVLVGSPIESIANTERIVEVIHHGHVIDRDRLALGPNLFSGDGGDAPIRQWTDSPVDPDALPESLPNATPESSPEVETFVDAVTVSAAPIEALEGEMERSWLDIVTTAGANADPIYAAQLMPGVVKVDGGSGLFVRGGEATETAAFLGQARLAHPFRFETPTGGFFGITDGLGVGGVSLATGGFSARYGNALSAVLELDPLPPPAVMTTDIGIGLGSASVRWARPLGSRGAVRVTGQRVDADAVIALNGGDDDFRVAPRSRDLGVTGYWQSERAGAFTLFALDQESEVVRRIEEGSFDDFFASDSANRIVALEWSKQHRGLDLEAAISTSRYRANQTAGIFALDTADRANVARFDLETWAGRYGLRAGAVWDDGRRRAAGRVPDVGRDFAGTAGTTVFAQRLATGRLGGYVEAERSFGRLRLILGSRFDRYRLPRDTSIEPRLTAVWTVDAKQSVRLAVGIYRQAPSALYFDRAVDTGDRGLLSLMTARHLTATYEWRTPSDPFYLRLDAYTKRYDDLPLERGSDAEGRVIFDSEGDGVANGFEAFARWERDRVSLSLSYSFVDAKRRFTPWLDQGRFGRPEAPFRPDFAIPHTIVAVVKGRLSAAWQWSATARIATGRPFTPIVGAEELDADAVDRADGVFFQPRYGAINSDRVPDYRRLDIGISRSFGLGTKGLAIAYLGINDLLDRNNAIAYAYSEDFSTRRLVGEGNGRSIYLGLTLQR